MPDNIIKNLKDNDLCWVFLMCKEKLSLNL